MAYERIAILGALLVCGCGGDDAPMDPAAADAATISADADTGCLELLASAPENLELDVPLTTAGQTFASTLHQFNHGIDEQSAVEAVSVTENGNPKTDLSVRVSVDDPTLVTVSIRGGLAPLAGYEVVFDGGLDGIRGNNSCTLPENAIVAFTAAAAP